MTQWIKEFPAKPYDGLRLILMTDSQSRRGDLIPEGYPHPSMHTYRGMLMFVHTHAINK